VVFSPFYLFPFTLLFFRLNLFPTSLIVAPFNERSHDCRRISSRISRAPADTRAK